MDIRLLHTNMEMAKEDNEAVASNMQYDIDDITIVSMVLVSFLPMIAGMIDNNFLNSIGCYGITWLQIVLIASAIICALDCRKLQSKSYNMSDNMLFAICATPIYLYRRGRIVNKGKTCCWTWIGVMLLVIIMAPQ